MVMANIEGKLAHMQEVYKLREASDADNDVSEVRAQRVQQMAEECVAEVSEAQKLPNNLHVKITAPAE